MEPIHYDRKKESNMKKWLCLCILTVISACMTGTCVAGDHKQEICENLSGKSILFVGDSLTSGYQLEDANDSWPARLSEYGMEPTIISVAGSTVAAARGCAGDQKSDYAPGGCYYPMCQRPLPEGDFDIIFVDCGANDMYCEIPLTTNVSTRNIYTFQGGFNRLIDRLQQKYPDALILVMTCWEDSSDYVNSYGYTVSSMRWAPWRPEQTQF